jgi:hypothetical protein
MELKTVYVADEKKRRHQKEAQVGQIMADLVPEPAPATAGMEQQEDSSGLLASLGQALLRAAGEKGEQAKALETLKEILPKLSVKEFPKLADEPVIQEFVERLAREKAASSDDPPGTIYNRGTLAEFKKDWTIKDLEKSGMPLITFTPAETILVTWNELRCQLIADQEITCYKCFYDVYQEHRRAMGFAREHAAFLFRKGPATHPDMALPDAARARATGDDGWYVPGGGSVAGGVILEGAEGASAE